MDIGSKRRITHRNVNSIYVRRGFVVVNCCEHHSIAVSCVKTKLKGKLGIFGKEERACSVIYYT